MQILDIGLTYDDVSLVPAYSDIPHRTKEHIDISMNLGKELFQLPVIASPMDTVTGPNMVRSMRNGGGLGIVHRYNTPHQQVQMVRDSEACAAAIGMTGDFMERAEMLVKEGVYILCIDTAHAHHINMEKALKSLRDRFGEDVHLMAGNVATKEGALKLSDWGADSIRVGIGGGSICSTRLQTGFGVPNITSLLEASRVKKSRNVKIIADGGIRSSGDINKAFAAGADFVMLGSMLAGTEESPGEVIEDAYGKKTKIYRGMASREAQHDWRGSSSTPEGISTTIPFKGSVKPILNNLAGWIRSGFSYVGAKDFESYRKNVKMIKQTNAGAFESRTHINL